MAASFHRRSFCSNEYQMQKVSHSVYVTNFPDSVNVRDLWKTCSTYGTVVDVFIPFKKSKADSNGKDGEPAKAVSISGIQKPNGRVNSYANIVNGVSSSMHGTLISSSHALVLDDSCLVDRDLSKHVMGKVKEFSSIPNIQTILSDKGFSGVKLTYLGGMWVMFEFDKVDTKKHMMQHTGIKSWFHVVQDAVYDFVSDERIMWVDIEGIPLNRLCIKTKHAVSILESFKVIVKGKVFMVRAKELFTWNPSFVTHKEREYSLEDESVHVSNSKHIRSQFNLEESDDDNASDEEGIPETVFGVNTSSNTHINEERGRQQSEDPFEIYDILDKQKIEQNRKSSPSLSHPPGFTPEVTEKPDEYATIDDVTYGKVDKEPSVPFNVKVMNSSQDVPEVSYSKYTGQNTVNNGGSVLGVLEDIIKVGQAMGYTMEGCANDLVNIIRNKGDDNDYISVLLGRWNGNSIIMGDFNEVRSIDERCCSVFNPYSARRFNRFISNSGIVDVKLEGYAFTWYHPSASKMSKLDRFLISEGSALGFLRFYHSWLDILGFDDMIKLAWQSFSHMDGNKLIRFKKKLQDLKVIIRRWVKEKRILTCISKSDLVNELGTIDKELDRGMISDASLLHRLELKRKLLNITEMETKDNIQRAKIKWAIEGDENSKFFHGIINKKRSQLAIRGIFVDGLWCTDPGRIKDAFLKHFETRFKEPDGHRSRLNFQFPRKLLQSQVEDLESHISRDEIRLAVWNCGDNKSPGPDGYTFEFFKKYWDFIGSDFSEAVEFFFINRSFSRGCNSSFVALIPKVVDAKFVNDFQPISLIGCVYKVVTKILSNRLSSVIADLVSDTQSAFISERQILDGPFILDEILNWCKRKNKQAMFFKVDFAKAYDSVRWDYLLDVLEGFGFRSTWCNWIRGTLSFAKASILVNGSPSKEFSFHRGLKQGDPIAPYLFILVMESLHLSFLRVVEAGLFKVPRGVLKALEAMRNRFFIGSDQSDRKITWVAWEKVLASKKNGGLGISSFFALNRALLLKWVWRFVSQDTSLWCQVIRALYGTNIDVHQSHISSNWCSIVREIQVLKEKGCDFWSHCKKRIGDGSDTWFWFDLWIGDSQLHIRFHRLFALELDKEISVADKMHFPLDHSFRRIARDGLERHQMTELQSMLDMMSLSQSRDRWFCDLTGDGEFRVKEVRNSIDDIFLPSNVEPTRWVKHIPIKVNIFAWRARRDCLLTRVNLIRRGISLESYICPVCRSCEEDAQHLFFQCDLAQSIWRRICRWWDLVPQLWLSFLDWQDWFDSICLTSKVKALLEGCSLGIIG
nr:RNA-directed DNA polymerase, eukaryota [Tanacetum cinerariifolium]